MLESQLNRWAFIWIGVCLAGIGLTALFQRGFLVFRGTQFIDFGPNHPWVGLALLLLGGCFVLVGLRSGRKRRA